MSLKTFMIRHRDNVWFIQAIGPSHAEFETVEFFKSIYYHTQDDDFDVAELIYRSRYTADTLPYTW